MSPGAWWSTPPSTGPTTAARPWHRYADTVVYEVHVKGFTMGHPGVPPELRGTYAGLAHDAAVAHLVDLGVTAVELLPVHQHVPEAFLVERGLTNYWGYNTIGFFAPHDGYSAAVRAGRPGGQVAEFQAMVAALHAAGLEVLLDVVFNHTAEGGQLGPTLCHRGLDNPAYYRLDPADPRRYVDTTGTGNSLNAGDPVCLQLIMDSLRYWLTEMGVDGFRFDLAPTLARQDGGFDRHVGVLRPGRPGPGGVPGQADRRAVGRRPARQLRRRPVPAGVERVERPLPRHDAGLLAPPGRARRRVRDPLQRLVRPVRRLAPAAHRLGQPHHACTTASPCATWSPTTPSTTRPTARPTGTGPTTTGPGTAGWRVPATTPRWSTLRARQSRALLTTLLLSFGVPLLCGGDELGRTQGGNNNAYCQDNAISWFDWSQPDDDLLAFTRRLIALRRAHPVLRRRRFLVGMEASELALVHARRPRP